MREPTGIADKVLAILDLFTEETPEWTPDEMISATGYARPTLYRYLKALREAGLVTWLSGAGYTLGPRIVEMDFLLRRSDPLTLAGEPFLRDLAATWPAAETIRFPIWRT